MNTITELVLAAVVACLILVIEHYWTPRQTHATVRYVLGILGLSLPLTVLWVVWKAWLPLAALWTVIAAGGISTLICYLVDGWRSQQTRLKILETEAHTLRQEVGYGKAQRP